MSEIRDRWKGKREEIKNENTQSTETCELIDAVNGDLNPALLKQ